MTPGVVLLVAACFVAPPHKCPPSDLRMPAGTTVAACELGKGPELEKLRARGLRVTMNFCIIEDDSRP